jgi:hypothetical protein
MSAFPKFTMSNLVTKQDRAKMRGLAGTEQGLFIGGFHRLNTGRVSPLSDRDIAVSAMSVRPMSNPTSRESFVKMLSIVRTARVGKD